MALQDQSRRHAGFATCVMRNRNLSACFLRIGMACHGLRRSGGCVKMRQCPTRLVLIPTRRESADFKHLATLRACASVRASIRVQAWTHAAFGPCAYTLSARTRTPPSARRSLSPVPMRFPHPIIAWCAERLRAGCHVSPDALMGTWRSRHSGGCIRIRQRRPSSLPLPASATGCGPRRWQLWP